MKKILYLILFLTLILFGCTFYQRAVGQVEFGDYAKAEIEKPESVEEMIVRKSKEANLNPSTSLKIARCESSMNPLAESTKSSAKGLFQFTNGTFSDGIKNRKLDWKMGDVFNAEKNTDMAMWYMAKGQFWRWKSCLKYEKEK